MKYIFFTLLMLMIGWNGIQQFTILDLKSLLWEQDRALGQCIEATGISKQEIQIELDRMEQEKYQEEQEPIDIYSEEELQTFEEEIYNIPTTQEAYVEQAYVEPKEDRKVCIEFEYYFDNEVCKTWRIIVE